MNCLVVSLLYSAVCAATASGAEIAPLHIQQVTITKLANGTVGHSLLFRGQHKFAKAQALKITVDDPKMQTVGQVGITKPGRHQPLVLTAPPILQTEGEGASQTHAWLIKLAEENVDDTFDIQVTIEVAPAAATDSKPQFVATLDESGENESVVRQILVVNSTFANWGRASEPFSLVLQEARDTGSPEVITRLRTLPLAKGAQRLLTDRLNVRIDSRTAFIELDSTTLGAIRPLPRWLSLGNGELSDQQLLRLRLPPGDIEIVGTPIAPPARLVTKVTLCTALPVGVIPSSGPCFYDSISGCDEPEHQARLQIGVDDDLSMTVSRSDGPQPWLPVAIDDKTITYVEAEPRALCVFNQGSTRRVVEFKNPAAGEGIFTSAPSYRLGAFSTLSLHDDSTVWIYNCSGGLKTIDRTLAAGSPEAKEAAATIKVLTANLKNLQSAGDRLLPVLLLNKASAPLIEQQGGAPRYLEMLYRQLQSLEVAASGVSRAEQELLRLVAAEQTVSSMENRLRSSASSDQFWRERLRLQLEREDLAKAVMNAKGHYEQATAAFAWDLAGATALFPRVTSPPSLLVTTSAPEPDSP